MLPLLELVLNLILNLDGALPIPTVNKEIVVHVYAVIVLLVI